jgi:hypothetical protein
MGIFGRLPLLYLISYGFLALIAAMWLFTMVEDLLEYLRDRKGRFETDVCEAPGSLMSLHRRRSGPPGQRVSEQGPHRGIAAPYPRLRAERVNRPDPHAARRPQI